MEKTLKRTAVLVMAAGLSLALLAGPVIAATAEELIGGISDPEHQAEALEYLAEARGAGVDEGTILQALEDSLTADPSGEDVEEALEALYDDDGEDDLDDDGDGEDLGEDDDSGEEDGDEDESEGDEGDDEGGDEGEDEGEDEGGDDGDEGDDD